MTQNLFTVITIISYFSQNPVHTFYFQQRRYFFENIVFILFSILYQGEYTKQMHKFFYKVSYHNITNGFKWI